MPARTALTLALLGFLPLGVCLLTGCRSGLIFTHTVEPLDVNFRESPVYRSGAEGDIKHVQYQQFQVQWDSNAIGDIARQAGFEQVYYADLETLRVLGIWNQYTVHVYGRPGESADPMPDR